MVFDSGRITQPAILSIIEQLGYEPRAVETRSDEPEQAPASRIALADLPPAFQELFAEARGLERPVLLDFIAPG